MAFEPTNQQANRETVARAICSACLKHIDRHDEARGDEHLWKEYLDAADAAMAAMSNLVWTLPDHPFNVGRVDDMPSGQSTVVVNSNGMGEISVCINERHLGRSATVTFGSSDLVGEGRSPATYAALIILMEAIVRDNELDPSLAHYSPAA